MEQEGRRERLWTTSHGGAGRAGQPGWREVPIVGQRWVKTRRRVETRQGLFCEDFEGLNQGRRIDRSHGIS